jgi:triosephosphate isomerase
MRKKIVAGNWKLNTILAEAISLTNEIIEKSGNLKSVQLIVCPPFPWIVSIDQLSNNAGISVGAQNCANEEKGAFTGEVSAAMLVSAGAKYVIVGHSERRALYGETDRVINQKVKLAIQAGLTVIFCCGESMQQRKDGSFKEVISSQLFEGLAGISEEQMSKVIVAYEPVWAIGTGLTASPEQAQEVHAFLRAQLRTSFQETIASSTSILYGGSCNAGNAASLFSMPDIDGGLIGGASLKADDFIAIASAL